MASIGTEIALQNNVTNSLSQMVNAVNAGNSVMDGFRQMILAPIQVNLFECVQESITMTTAAVQDMNTAMEEGASKGNGLGKALKGVVDAYATMENLTKVINLSDQFTAATARLDQMNDGEQTTAELQNMIFGSAERSRVSYQSTADTVSGLGLTAGDTFGSTEEIVAFVEQVNKQFAIAGVGPEGIAAAMPNMTQIMSSGNLSGEDYDSLLQQAPNMIQAIGEYMGIPQEKLREMAAEGQITAEVIKGAMFQAADETDRAFCELPMSFEQILTSFGNNALMAFRPILEGMNEVANSEWFQNMVNGAINGLALVAGLAQQIFELLVGVAETVAENWSWLAPIIYGVAAALLLYAGYLAIVKLAELASAVVKGIVCLASFAHAAATGTEVSATLAATAAQYGFNTALLSCPLTWIILLLGIVIAVIIALANHFSGAGHVAQSAFGAICGSINVAIQFSKNLWLMIKNIALGIGNAMGAVGTNIAAAFHNAISYAKSLWYGLLATALLVIEGICEKLNKLPFVEFDYSGVANAADEYAAKAAAEAENKREYTSIEDAFNEGMSTYDAFQDGWASDAYKNGAAMGDYITDKVGGFFSDMFGKDNPPFSDEYIDQNDNGNDYGSGLGNDYGSGLGGYGDGLEGIGSGVDQIAENTGDMADAMEITGEELKYLRDIAEQEAINRFTTAEINIEQTNHNNVSSGMDLDGVVSGLDEALGEAIEIMTEGVHV